MIRLSKLTDYGLVLLTRFASAESETWFTARDLSDKTALPLPTVSKLLKIFGKGGLLIGQRGVYGGYRLARPADQISVVEIIEVIDGPLAVTDCACGDRTYNSCSIEDHCPTKPHWIKITLKIRTALADITLSDMAKPAGADIPALDSCQSGQCKSVNGEPCGCNNHNTHFLPSIDGAD